MFSNNLIGLVLWCLVALSAVAADHEYVFEFGDSNKGSVIDQQNGVISLLSYNNNFPLHIPSNTVVTYVKVIVEALSSPKVDYDKSTSKVSIKYSWTQVSLSKYKILAKGVHFLE